MMRIIPQRCIPLRFGGSRSKDFHLDRSGRAPALCGCAPSHDLRGYESASTWITLAFKDQNLRRRLMPRPKFGRSRPPTAATPPATVRLVYLQIVGREQMTIAAGIGYGHGRDDTFQGKAHHISFGCFKARPRYHFLINNLQEELQRIRNSCARHPWIMVGLILIRRRAEHRG